jgi:hypothetical protein
MNYKNKYLKYKLKYLNQKNNNMMIGGTHNKCLLLLDTKIKEKENELLIILFIKNYNEGFLSHPQFNRALSELKKNSIKEIYEKYFTNFDLDERMDTYEKFIEVYHSKILPSFSSKGDDEYNMLKKIEFINNSFYDLLNKNNGIQNVLKMSEISNIFENINRDELNIEDLYIKYNEISNTPNIMQLKKFIFVPENIDPILFFIEIMKSYSDNDCYVIGDSCLKFKNMCEILKIDNIDIIYFSGNMFNNRDHTNINTEYKQIMDTNYIYYYQNNKKLIDKIFCRLKDKSHKKVIIYDYIFSGVSILTFIEFLKLLNKEYFNIDEFENIIKNKIIFINYFITSDELADIKKGIYNITKQLLLPQINLNYILIYLDFDVEIRNHFVHSDYFDHYGSFNTKICSRCVSSYKASEWNNPPSEVYIDDVDSLNYIGCNLNKMYIYLFLSNIYLKNYNIKKDYTTYIYGKYEIFSDYIKCLNVTHDDSDCNLFKIEMR